MTDSFFHLLQTSDSFFPSGSYAHSNGLEGLVQAGVVQDQESLKEFINSSVIPTLRQVDLPFLRFAYEAACAGDEGKLTALSVKYHAMKGSRELRDASLKIGAQRLRMLAQLHRDMNENEKIMTHAVIVCGIEAQIMEIPLNQMMMAFYYQAVLSYLSASLKLLKIGHTAVQLLLRSFLDKGPNVLEASEKISEEQAGWFAPLWDIASARHETAYSRLFIS